MWIHELLYLYFDPRHTSPSPPGFSLVVRLCAWPRIPFLGFTILLRPYSSDNRQYWNMNQLSIDYDFRPRLRSRLTQSRSALLWKPWIFGLEDSHFYLATHSGILTCIRSTAPFGTASAPIQRSSTNHTRYNSVASVVCFSPGHFRRRISRLVSYYALFECMAASKPTS